MGKSASLSTTKPSLLWEKTHPSLDPNLSGTESPLLKVGTTAGLCIRYLALLIDASDGHEGKDVGNIFCPIYHPYDG